MQNPIHLSPAEITAFCGGEVGAIAPLITWEQIDKVTCEPWDAAHLYLVCLVEQANRAAMRGWIETHMPELVQEEVLYDSILTNEELAEIEPHRAVLSDFVYACDVYTAESYPLLDEDLHSRMEWELYEDAFEEDAKIIIRGMSWPGDTAPDPMGEDVGEAYNEAHPGGGVCYSSPGDPRPYYDKLTTAIRKLNDEAWDDAVELTYHGVERSDYFQGVGTSFTKYTDVQVGIGMTPRSAIEDAIEGAADTAPREAIEAMERALNQDFITPWATAIPDEVEQQDEDDEMYCYGSVRWVA